MWVYFHVGVDLGCITVLHGLFLEQSAVSSAKLSRTHTSYAAVSMSSYLKSTVDNMFCKDDRARMKRLSKNGAIYWPTKVIKRQNLQLLKRMFVCPRTVY